MVRAFSEDDVGKTVVNADDTEVGMVKEVDADTAHVDPDPGITDQIRSRLGWTESGQETYPLRADEVEAITDDEIRLSASEVQSG